MLCSMLGPNRQLDKADLGLRLFKGTCHMLTITSASIYRGRDRGCLQGQASMGSQKGCPSAEGPA